MDSGRRGDLERGIEKGISPGEGGKGRGTIRFCKHLEETKSSPMLSAHFRQARITIQHSYTPTFSLQ